MKVQTIESHPQQALEMPGAVNVKMRMLIGPQENANVFHMRHFEVAPGGYTPHHQHDYEHEIVVLKGQGLARSAQGERSIQAGQVIWVPANEMHQFHNPGPSPLEFICLIPAPKCCG